MTVRSLYRHARQAANGLAVLVALLAVGGAWLLNGNTVNSVTTYGYPQDPFTNFGPYFGGDVAKLYKRAKQIK